VKNPYLQRKLAEIGRDTEETWKSIIANEGSVQHLDFLDPHTKRVFQTAFEIPQKAIVQLAIDRGGDICQAQSLNVFFAHDADAEYMTQVHYMAWEGGLKSLYYLRSTTPSRAENPNTAVSRTATTSADLPVPAPVEDEVCFSCQG
jgi:ribonucleoside-diphosphate reductase alpha chain